ncbi:MAG: hypothetical protein SO137_10010, partial [Gemmiger sp.]|uniref:hypothetical protein n=1 Tax=Gemmiger sp. TaxID=2049027 RepID=UPI002A81ED8F
QVGPAGCAGPCDTFIIPDFAPVGKGPALWSSAKFYKSHAFVWLRSMARQKASESDRKKVGHEKVLCKNSRCRGHII